MKNWTDSWYFSKILNTLPFTSLIHLKSVRSHFISIRIPLSLSPQSDYFKKNTRFSFERLSRKINKDYSNAANYHRGANWRFRLPLEWQLEELLRACSCERKSRMKGTAVRSAECLERVGSHTYLDYLALAARRRVWL